MSLFSKKEQRTVEDFCREFYEKNIFSAKVESIDFNQTYSRVLYENVIEVDPSFKEISQDKLASELILIRLEVFSLAFTHSFKEKDAIAQSVFTKSNLHEQKRDNVWDDLLFYNQAISRAVTLALQKSNTAWSSTTIAVIDELRKKLVMRWINSGINPECVGRVANRVESKIPWQQDMVPGILMCNLCDRIGCSKGQPNKEAEFRLTSAIKGFYDGAVESFKKTKITS